MAKEPKEQTEKKKKQPEGMDSHIFSFEQLEDINFDYRIPCKSLIMSVFLDGGFRPGVTRFSAPEEHGKSAVALDIADEFLTYFYNQGKKARVIYFDAECRLTAKKIKASRIHLNKYFSCKGDKEKDTFVVYKWNRYEDIANSLVENMINDKDEQGNKIYYYFIIDSLDVLITQDGVDKGFDESEKVASAQTLSTVLMKKLAPYLEPKGHMIYIASQIRANLDMNNPNSPKTRVSGGHMIKHAVSLYGDIQQNGSHTYIYENEKGKSVAEKGNVIGHWMTIKWKKTFNEKTNTVIRVPIKYQHGVWVEREIVELALQYEQIKQKGAWFAMADQLANSIDDSLTASLKKEFILLKVKELGLSENLKQKDFEKAIDKVSKDFEKEINEIKFKCERTWQGVNNIYEYLESNKLVTQFLFNDFKSRFIVTGERVEGDDEKETL